MDKKKILVVEDEKAIADILVFNLQREGYDTLAAYAIGEGLETVLLTALPELAAVSSTVVRDIASYGKDVSRYLPETKHSTDNSLIK